MSDWTVRLKWREAGGGQWRLVTDAPEGDPREREGYRGVSVEKNIDGTEGGWYARDRWTDAVCVTDADAPDTGDPRVKWRSGGGWYRVAVTPVPGSAHRHVHLQCRASHSEEWRHYNRWEASGPVTEGDA